MIEALQFVATLTATLFAGAALYINVAEHPARMTLATSVAASQWAPSYRRATLLQAPLALVSFASGSGAWLLGASVAWFAAAVLIGLVVPFTFIVVMPTNRKLLESNRDMASEETRSLLVKWNQLHAVRTSLSLGASFLYLTLLFAAGHLEESFITVPVAASEETRVAGADQPLRIGFVPDEPYIIKIAMRRSGCYGECPIYNVEVQDDGSVQFEGLKFVAKTGKHSAKISPVEYAEISLAIENADFSSLSDHYRTEADGCKSVVTDNPSVEIVVTYRNVDKSVSYYYGCRGLPVAEKIDALAKRIDAATQTERWIQ